MFVSTVVKVAYMDIDSAERQREPVVMILALVEVLDITILSLLVLLGCPSITLAPLQYHVSFETAPT